MFFSENCDEPTLVDIPDPNFEQALVDLTIDSDGIVNALIDIEDILNVTLLDVSSRGIIDLSAIEFFASLKTLIVSNNSLNILDLSQNTEIESVIVENNNLINFNIQNGNNASITNEQFNITNNPNLICAKVDDVNYSFANWFNKDEQTVYGFECEPDNDDCIDAPLLALDTVVTGTTFSSSPSGLDPGCQQSGITIFDVWYRFEGPSSGSITLFIDGASGIIKVAIYDTCNATSPIACGIDGLEINNLVEGQEYYVQVWVDADVGGRSLDTMVGDFTIEVVDSSSLSISDDQLESEFLLFPNPANNYITISSAQSINGYQIFDLSGKLILQSKNLNTQEHLIELNSISKGIYLIKVDNEKGSLTKKLIIN